MKFIHLSDIRIGSNAESGTQWEEERLVEIESGLTRIMDEAVEFGADLIIISGGLFSHIPTSAELDELSRLFAGYPDKNIVIIAGETDIIKKSSPVMSYLWPINVHYCLEGKPDRIVLSDIHTEVLASSLTEFDSVRLEDIAGAAKANYPDEQPVRIVVIRSDQDAQLAAAFADTGVSYVALGSSIPGNRDISPIIHCPGNFEPEAMGDGGKHGLLEGVISEQTGLLENVEFVPMASVSYIPLVVKTTVKTTSQEVEQLVEREITKRGENNIYRIKIMGARNPEESFALDLILKKYRISELIDETEPEYDFKELFAEHPQDMIGFYISRILNNRHEMSPVEKKAMFYGLDALIRTSDE